LLQLSEKWFDETSPEFQMAAALYCQRLKLVQSSYVSHPATNNNASQAYILGYMPNRFIK
jgi:hypothetical protein